MLWVHRSSDLCIFFTIQLKIWDYPILKQCTWFLKCPLIFCTTKEEKIKRQTCTKLLFVDDVDLIEDEVVKQELHLDEKSKQKCGVKTRRWCLLGYCSCIQVLPATPSPSPSS